MYCKATSRFNALQSTVIIIQSYQAILLGTVGKERIMIEWLKYQAQQDYSIEIYISMLIVVFIIYVVSRKECE